MTSSTSLIISGSSALVGSSSRMSFGFIASDRAIATRCCWPPDSCAGIFFAWLATPTRSSSSIALASASFRDFFFTLIGARVTFSSTVLCAKRLNDWNTMPTSARSLASAAPSSGSATPSIAIVPESIVSSRLMARQRVDLPEPDGPMTTTTSPRLTTVLMSLSTCSSPKCLSTCSMTTSGSPRRTLMFEVAGAGWAGSISLKLGPTRTVGQPAGRWLPNCDARCAARRRSRTGRRMPRWRGSSIRRARRSAR